LFAVHPAEEGGRAESHLLTDDVAATVDDALQAEGIELARLISDQVGSADRYHPGQAPQGPWNQRLPPGVKPP
jgi:hypothetical protein